MIEPLRLVCFGWPVSAVEEAESIQSHPVHISVHLTKVAFQQGFHEPVVSRGIFLEPLIDHPFEHGPDLPVRQSQVIFRPSSFHIKDHCLHAQIAAGKEKAPHCAVLIIQLIKDNLFVQCRMVYASLQKALHHHFYLWPAFANQLPGQAVGAGVRPVGSQAALVQEV